MFQLELKIGQRQPGAPDQLRARSGIRELRLRVFDQLISGGRMRRARLEFVAFIVGVGERITQAEEFERNLISSARKEPKKKEEVAPLAQFDFDAVADVTDHPYRVQCEQSKLTRILQQQLSAKAEFELQFNARVQDVTQLRSGVEVAIERNGGTERRSGRWLIGADGARSDVRRATGIEFPGFTWPERFLVVSTPFDFHGVIPDLVAVSYVADPERWHFLLQIPGLCRVMFPIAAHESDELALNADFAQSLMAAVVPGISNYDIAHTTLYKVHQRVAETFRRGRVFLAGDAAHINNPLGGMGMNGGIHDAINLTSRLVEVWRGREDDSDLERYDRQRRAVTLEYIEQQSIQNKRNLESDGTEFGRNLAQIAADKRRTYDYLLRVSMIASLRRAQELG